MKGNIICFYIGAIIITCVGLERIMVLNLNNNAISDVGLNAFKGLMYIKFIDLSRNRLYKVDPATFKSNLSLKYLVLSRNPLRTIPSHRPFLISNSLQTLEMSHCGFSYFPEEAFALLSSLKYLNISNNNILMLPENVLNFLKNLRVLDISKILVPLLILSTKATFADAIFCPPYCKCSGAIELKYVNYSGQKLINLVWNIPTSVQWLDLSNNSISLLRDRVFKELGLDRIIALNLNNNAINYVGLKAFEGLMYIKFIDLSGNRLNHVNQATFRYNPTLTHLILSRNLLGYTGWSYTFLISNSLQNLEMSHCGISYFPGETLVSLPSLKYLNIANNRIKSLEENFFHFSENLRVLDISNTAIECGIRTTHLIILAHKKSGRIIGTSCFGYSVKYRSFTKNFLNKSRSNSFEECSCRCPKKVLENSVETSTIRPTEIPDRRKFTLHEVFFCGLIIGAVLSISTTIFRIYCYKDRNRSNNTPLPQRPAQCNNIPNETHETLPSSYTDPQRPSQCNNIPNETHEIPPLSCTDSRRPAQCNNIPNETPPPSYNDLFMIC